MDLQHIFNVAWSVILSIGAAGALILGFAKYLGDLFSKWAMGEVRASHERAMAEIRRQNELELEEYRSKLNKLAHRSEVRFSKLHEKRAEVIAKLYSKLVALRNVAKRHLGGPVSVQVSQKPFWRALAETRQYFEENEIYFETELCELLNDFLAKLLVYDAEKDISHSILASGQDEGREWTSERTRERWDFLNTHLPGIRKQMLQEFRALLGVLEK